MGFIILLAFTTVTIAGAAGFFSIYGLAQIFSGAFWPVVIMGSSLEAGKLVAASFVYRYWKQTSIFLRAYLMIAILILMVITSAGIFGFLSGAYQQDMLPIKQNAQQILLLEQDNIELAQLKLERLDRKKQIDADIAALPNNYITARKQLLKVFGPELDQLKLDVADYTAQIRANVMSVQELKQTVLEQEAHTGPIIFIASVFDRDVDDTTKWLILMIIFAFDPLAVALTIGTNQALRMRKETKNAGTDTEVVNALPKSIEQLLDGPVEGLTIEQIREALANFEVPEHQMTPEERMHVELLRQQLAKKEITERIRTGA